MDGGQRVPLTESFRTVDSFKKAFSDDLDQAVIEAGWRSCSMEEDGVTYKAYFRPVLDLVMALLRTRKVRLWSGDGAPGPPTDRRETPMDGDAFRLCETELAKLPGRNCVLGLHVFSDSSQLSWSGGNFCHLSFFCWVFCTMGSTLSHPFRFLICMIATDRHVPDFDALFAACFLVPRSPQTLPRAYPFGQRGGGR